MQNWVGYSYRRKIWPELEKFILEIKGKSVLDIGSGTCPVSKKLAKDNRVTAVE